jgi:protein CLEC16A
MKSLSIFFDLFVRCKSKELNILAVDYLSKLLINISNPHSLDLMLSNSMIANMQTIRFVTMPLELAEYYINFLKTLALKVNNKTINLFFNQVRNMKDL